MKQGLLTGMSSILNLYLSTFKYSQHYFIAINSLPNELLSIEDCFLENQYKGALLTITRNPVLDLLIKLSYAKSVSTKALIINSLPIGFGV